MDNEIEDYNFCGDAISARKDCDGDIEVTVYYGCEDVYFTKDDIIAMAKAVGVTPELLK